VGELEMVAVLLW